MLQNQLLVETKRQFATAEYLPHAMPPFELPLPSPKKASVRSDKQERVFRDYPVCNGMKMGCVLSFTSRCASTESLDTNSVLKDSSCLAVPIISSQYQ